MICKLATWDDSHPRTSLGLPPYTIITHPVERQQLVSCTFISFGLLFIRVSNNVCHVLSTSKGHRWGLHLCKGPGPTIEYEPRASRSLKTSLSLIAYLMYLRGKIKRNPEAYGRGFLQSTELDHLIQSMSWGTSHLKSQEISRSSILHEYGVIPSTAFKKLIRGKT
ncbi:hypothetical protein TNCV_1485711 [Trichonephila clavipes]|nr:hypothetical protein TNCV_1485711 [Trichonephila clavipes]